MLSIPVQGLVGGSEASVSRQAGSLPFPGKPVGTVNEEMPFDHVVVVMAEAKWNLPALTRRDANAPTVMDFLDPGTAAFLASENHGSFSDRTIWSRECASLEAALIVPQSGTGR
jgi:hypothetical protein